MQKIKLTIAGRVYPLNVNKDDESQIRESAKSINSMINHFEKNYAVKDKQDVLAMCALQIAVQSIKDFDSSAREVRPSDVRETPLRAVPDTVATAVAAPSAVPAVHQ